MKKELIFELMKDTNLRMYNKFHVRSLKHPHDDILNKDISLSDMDIIELVKHLKLEIKEFNEAWAWRKFLNVQDECIDIMNMCFLIHHTIEHKYPNHP